MSALKDRNVLVTGGASGLGEGFARAFAGSGSRLLIADRNKEAGAALEKELQAAGHQAKYFHVDVTNTGSIATMLGSILTWLPTGEAIDTAILSAGVNGNPFDLTPAHPSALSQPESLDAVKANAMTMQINLIAVLQCIQLIVKFGMGLAPPQTPPQPTSSPTVKSITLIGSLASYRGLPRAVDYTASKFGIRGIFRSLRQQLPAVGVRVNLVAPGFVKTPLLAATTAMYEQMGVNFAKREDVVQAVVQAANDQSCSGRAFGVSSEGVIDMNDDAEGMDGSVVMNDLVTRDALGNPGCPMGKDEPRVVFK